MKEAGFSYLRFNMDGLSKNTLRLQRKDYTKDMVMQNLKHCHDLGIYTEINVVIGVPGETDEDVEESADFIIEMKPYIGRVAFINPLMMFVGSVYYFEPEHHNVKFRSDKDELYKQYFVSLPDSAWYSENPYIDHEIRRKRFFRIVDRIHSVNVPLGAFANFTAEYRKEHGEDSHTVTQQRPSDAANPTNLSTPVETPAAVANANTWTGESLAPRVTVDREKTEFQKTFYGSWSTAFLTGLSGARSVGSGQNIRVVKLDGVFYLAKDSVVVNTQLVTLFATPQLLRSYRGYNLVGYRDQILAAPLVLGPLNLAEDDVRSDPRILKARTQDKATSLIDVIEESRHLGDGLAAATTARLGNGTPHKIRSFFSVPSLLRSYKQYNLVAFRNQILAAPLSMGHVDLNQDAARADARILKGATEEDVVRQIDALEVPVQATASATKSDKTRLPAGVKKVNMGAGVLLRWGK